MKLFEILDPFEEPFDTNERSVKQRNQDAVRYLQGYYSVKLNYYIRKRMLTIGGTQEDYHIEFNYVDENSRNSIQKWCIKHSVSNQETEKIVKYLTLYYKYMSIVNGEFYQ